MQLCRVQPYEADDRCDLPEWHPGLHHPPRAGVHAKEEDGAADVGRRGKVAAKEGEVRGAGVGHRVVNVAENKRKVVKQPVS